jgi:hypothetical protein
MTTTTRNEAAGRLLDWVGLVEQPAHGENSIYDELKDNLLPAALAAERRATVERIRERWNKGYADGKSQWVLAEELDAILDEEAAR